MQNKKTAVALVVFAVIAFVLVTFFVLRKSSRESVEQIVKMNDAWTEYSEMQNQFVLDLPCGVTDFDSPYVKPVQCASNKMKKGTSVKMNINGAVYDEDGNAIDNVEIRVNNGTAFYTDTNGDFRSEVEIDSNKKVVNLVANKTGYSPIRRVLNAAVPNEEGVAIGIPKDFNAGFTMRKIEVQNVTLRGDAEIVVKSEKYPGVSVTIPPNGLENAAGKIVTGEVTGEITYLDPNKPEDRAFTPGFDGNVMQMVGVDRQGNQVLIESQGMVFFHFKESGSNEILQPRKGATIVITQPMTDEDYAILTNEEIQKAGATDEDIKYWESLGITQDASEEEVFKASLENNSLMFNYWYFNERTGLWEEWPVKRSEYDTENRLYRMEVPRFY